jgi:hypothetical protein
MIDYITVPEGTYRIRIAEVRERETRRGDALWELRLAVAGGEFEGRIAAWDNLVFSPRGLARVARIFGALGIPTEGKVIVEAEALVDLEADITSGLPNTSAPTARSSAGTKSPTTGGKRSHESHPLRLPHLAAAGLRA